MKKKILAAILALSIASISGLSAFAADTTDQEEIKIAEESYVDTVVDMLDKDWYGGVYYEGDTVHIIATDGNAENIQSLVKRTRNADGVNTIVVDSAANTRSGDGVYSITELESAKEYLLSKQDDLGIVAVGFNGEENALAVYLDNYENVTDEQKDAIVTESEVKNIMFRDAKVFLFMGEDVVIEENETAEDNEAVVSPRAANAIKGGDWLCYSNGSKWSTLTTSAVYDFGGANQQKGLFTCGHGWNVGDSVYWNGQKIGTVMIRNQSGDTDFSFVKISSDAYNTKGYMLGGKIQLTGRRNPSTSMSIKSFGAVGGVRTGKVLDTNISGEWSNIYFDDLFSTTIPTNNGDSGSAYTYNDTDLVGILKGGYGGYSVSVGTKIMNIINQYNVQPSYSSK